MHKLIVGGLATLLLLTGCSSPREAFLHVAEWLLEHQDAAGALRYDFAWHYYLTGETFAPGWVSGMAQGQALSVFARAYDATGDARYLAAGAKALEFLLTPAKQGGALADLDPSLGRYPIIEEYVAEPASYTLNGYMFALLGLYDWSTLEHPSAATAQRYSSRGLETLRKILPYYDLGGISTYDLGYLILPTMPNHTFRSATTPSTSTSCTRSTPSPRTRYCSATETAGRVTSTEAPREAL